jgi:hypothetical protein
VLTHDDAQLGVALVDVGLLRVVQVITLGCEHGQMLNVTPRQLRTAKTHRWRYFIAILVQTCYPIMLIVITELSFVGDTYLAFKARKKTPAISAAAAAAASTRDVAE